MSLGFYEQRRRRRTRFFWSAARVLCALALIGAAGAYAYEMGSRLAAARIDALDREVAAVSRQLAEATATNQTLAQQLAAERAKAASLQQRYDRDVPTGALRDVYALIGDKLSDGLSVERLQALVRATEPAKACEAQIARKRLIVLTSESQATDGTVGSFADGSLVVRVSGDAARTAGGQPESWFDTARPVTVRVARPGGRTEQWTGTLPLHPVVVLGGNEYRFSIAGDARGLVQIAMQRCRED